MNRKFLKFHRRILPIISKLSRKESCLWSALWVLMEWWVNVVKLFSDCVFCVLLHLVGNGNFVIWIPTRLWGSVGLFGWFWFIIYFVFLVTGSCRFSHDVTTNLWGRDLVNCKTVPWDCFWIRGNITVQIKGRLPTNKISRKNSLWLLN